MNANSSIKFFSFIFSKLVSLNQTKNFVTSAWPLNSFLLWPFLDQVDLRSPQLCHENRFLRGFYIIDAYDLISRKLAIKIADLFLSQKGNCNFFEFLFQELSTSHAFMAWILNWILFRGSCSDSNHDWKYLTSHFLVFRGHSGLE